MQTDEFEKLATQHQDAIYRQMLRVCMHREDAEDALATALMQAFTVADQLKSADAFRSWVGTIGRRGCTKMRKHPSMMQAYDYALEQDLVSPGEGDVELEFMRGCVHEAFEQLPQIYREIYGRCELEEEPVNDAAQALGITLAAAKSRLRRARILMREQLDRSICGA